MSKGNQSWIFIERTDAEAEAPTLWPPDSKNWLTGKDPDAGKDWRQEEKGTTVDEMFGWHQTLPTQCPSPTQWTWVWASSRRRWRTRKPGVLQSMGSQGVKTWLSNWTTKSGWKKSFSSLTPLIRWTAGLTNNEISWPRPYFDQNTRTMSYLLRDS